MKQKNGLPRVQASCLNRNSVLAPILWGAYYLLVVVSMGWDGIDPVVSTGVVTTVSVVTGDVVIESVVEGGADISLPDEFSGVSQPIAAIARKSPKKMLFIN